jgi:hypothetical protein
MKHLIAIAIISLMTFGLVKALAEDAPSVKLLQIMPDNTTYTINQGDKITIESASSRPFHCSITSLSDISLYINGCHGTLAPRATIICNSYLYINGPITTSFLVVQNELCDPNNELCNIKAGSDNGASVSIICNYI